MCAGVTAEYPSLTDKEYKSIIDVTIEEVNGRAPVIVTTGSCNTSDTIKMSQYAEDAGADAVIVHAPYFWLPTREGIYEYYRAVAESIRIPVFLFNNPHRAGVDLDAQLIGELAKVDRIVGIKKAVRDITKFLEDIKATSSEFSVFSGYDTMLLPVLSVGGKGVFSVVGNVVPRLVVDCFDSFRRKDLERARKLQFEILPIAKILFEHYPASVKMALKMQGAKYTNIVRMPLSPLSEKEESKLKNALADYLG